MEKIPKSVRDSLARQQGADMHPDADLLTAFGEGSATERERQTVLAHLAVCAECREVLALALPEIAPQTVVAPERQGWARRWMWVPALSAVAIVAISATLLLNREQVHREQGNREQKTQATETAGVARQQTPLEEPPASSSALAPSARISDAAPAAAAKDSGRNKKHEDKSVTASSQLKTAETESKEASSALVAKRVDTDKVEAGRAFHGSMAQPEHPEIGIAQQTVEVTGAAPMIDVNPANAPAALPPQPLRKPAGRDYRAMGRVLGGNANSATMSGPLAQNQNTQNQNMANNTAESAPREKAKKESAAMPAATPAPPPPPPSTAGYIDVATSKVDVSTMRANWHIDAEGHLLRSIGANSFTPVIGDKQTVFRAVSVNGTDIWVGGNAGALYHSSDNGVQWTRVDVLDAGNKLTANIVGVRFQDAQRGVIKTESGQSWTTADGGATWTKNAIR